ncbi:MAG: AraC family transcriptional regulator [Clostridium sp.]|nr:AraC family transcriptional regulator [Bacteroides sp.]MCM1197332.1 AraC family transcriptional regulator [Clostridium sp.]
MNADINFFSWLVYAAITVFFLGLTALTVLKWIRNEFISPEFPAAVSASSLCLLFLISSDVLYVGNVSGFLLADIGFSSMPLIVLLFSGENKSAVRNLAAIVLAVSFAAFLSRMMFPESRCIVQGTGGLLTLMLICVSLLLVAGCVWRRISDVRKWVYRTNLSAWIETMVNFVYLLLLVFCPVAGAIIGRDAGVIGHIFIVPGILFMLVLYACMYRRVLTGSILLMFKAKENEIRETMKVCASDYVIQPKEDVCYRVIFDRLVEYFDKEKPFLDSDLNIGDVSKRLMTNKAYLSRTINKYTGRNFCQYVNYYRIRHSVQLFTTEPNLKIADLATKSGFHSLVTFGMAFRLYMNDSPGEWCRRNREILTKKKGDLPQ